MVHVLLCVLLETNFLIFRTKIAVIALILTVLFALRYKHVTIVNLDILYKICLLMVLININVFNVLLDAINV